MNYLSIEQLSLLVKSSLPKKTIKVSGEISAPKKSHGHTFLALKDKKSTINTVLWKSKNNNDKLNEGDNIDVSGKLDYYPGNGRLSFIIDKIDNFKGIGELNKKYDKIKKDFEQKGYFDKKNKFTLPKIIKNILLITSKTGAAIQDFFFALENNNSKLEYDVIDVAVQGINCPKDIIKQLSILDKKYDLVVITRGGGSFDDLFGFSQPELIEFIHTFNQPVLSAIGHQVDTSLLDLVADVSSPTPSLAAQFIVDNNNAFINKYKKNLTIKKQNLIQYNLDKLLLLRNHKDKLYKIRNNIISEYKDKLYKMKESLELIYQSKNRKIKYLKELFFKYKYDCNSYLSSYRHNLIKTINDRSIELNKYQIILDNDKSIFINNKLIKSANELAKLLRYHEGVMYYGGNKFKISLFD